MTEAQTLIVVDPRKRAPRLLLLRGGFERQLSAALVLLDALCEFTQREMANKARPAAHGRPVVAKCGTVLTAEDVRRRRELDGLALVSRGGRAVCLWLSCPRCRRSFATVTVPPGAQYCRPCAAPKKRRKR
jgi:hypothetical protein